MRLLPHPFACLSLAHDTHPTFSSEGVRTPSPLPAPQVSTFRLVGVPDSAWVLSHMAHAVCLSCVIALLAYLAGLCAQLPLFLSADGTVLLAVFLVYLIAMGAYAFAIAMAVRTVKASMVPAVGMMLVCIALAALSHTPTANAVAYLWWEPAFPSAAASLVALLLPPLSLLKV